VRIERDCRRIYSLQHTNSIEKQASSTMLPRLGCKRSMTSMCLLGRGSYRSVRSSSHYVTTKRFKSHISIVSNNDLVPRETPNAKQTIDFQNSQANFSAKTTAQVLRATIVYQFCKFPLLVKNADYLLRISRSLLGDTITDNFLKATFFGQFCAGEDEQTIQPVMEYLNSNGIGGILDYAAENDIHPGMSKQDNDFPGTSYDYESEAACDVHVEAFRSCIRSVAKVAPDGFAALKITALGNPKLLERMSHALKQAEKLFSNLDTNRDGVVSRQEFKDGYRYYFTNVDEKLPELLELLDPCDTGTVDYITWTKLFTPQDLPRLIANLHGNGTLPNATLTEEELKLMEVMFHRAYKVADEAVKCGTKILVDAEQTRFQPAIDTLVFHLQQKFNSTETAKSPVIFNTYQCYLKDTVQRLRMDVERSERFSYHFGAKLVRGAYMESEKASAAMLHYPSPIHETVEDTHMCYNDSVEFLIRKSVESNREIEVMCATHNENSIRRAIQLMGELGIAKDSHSVYFGQLFGMSDNLTFNLGKHGYRTYKYVPYGEVKQVMPFLMRRAQENSSVLGNAKRELEFLKAEVWRRMKLPFRTS